MGVRKGLGAAVGGVFGTAGKITGAAGKAFAILSFDDEYQRKRRQQQQKPPADLQVVARLLRCVGYPFLLLRRTV